MKKTTKDTNDASFVDNFLKDFQTKVKKQREKRESEEKEQYEQFKKDKETTSSLISLLDAGKKEQNLARDKEFLLLEKQEYLRDLRKQVQPGSHYTFVNNSIQFFEQNMGYFVKHSLEFQRLVAQLRTNQERQLFLHTISMYYYADVLLLLNKQQKEEPTIDPTPLNSLLWQFHENQPPVQEQSVDETKIAHVYKTILKDHKLLSENDHEQFYNLLLQLNTKETLIVEKLLD